MTCLFILFFFRPPPAGENFRDIMNQLQVLDPIGLILFLPAIICLLLALQWGGSTYPWGNWRIILMFALAGVLALAFCFVQYQQQGHAMIPVRLLKNRNVLASCWYGICLGGAFFVLVYYVRSTQPLAYLNLTQTLFAQLPIWFQSVKGASSVESGIMYLPTMLGLVLGTTLSGALITLIGYYTPFILASSVLTSIGVGLLSTLEASSGHRKWIGYQALTGFGLGLGLQQTIIVVQTVLPASDVPNATAIVMLMQTLGGSISVAVGQGVFESQLIANLLKFAPTVDVTSVVAAGATNLRHVVAGTALPGVLQAYNNAISQTFYVAVAMAGSSLLAALFLEWKSVKTKPAARSVAEL